MWAVWRRFVYFFSASATEYHVCHVCFLIIQGWLVICFPPNGTDNQAATSDVAIENRVTSPLWFIRLLSRD